MPSSVKCTEGHRTKCQQAAREIAENGALRPCHCGAERHYVVRHVYPGKGEAQLELMRVAIVHSRRQAERIGYDPMLFELKIVGGLEDHRVHRPFYWTKNRNGQWHVGQFPPIFWEPDQLPQLVRQLTARRRVQNVTRPPGRKPRKTVPREQIRRKRGKSE